MSQRVYDALSDRYDKAMEWNRVLVQQIVDMRREGFASLPSTKAPERTDEQRARANVEEALSLASGGDRDHARVMRAQVYAWRAEGRSDEDIAAELLKPTTAIEDGVPA